MLLIKPLTLSDSFLTHTPPGTRITDMGQQSNKVQKRRRRAAYLERKKTKLKQAVTAPPKPKPRKAPVKRPSAVAKSAEPKAAPPKPAESAPAAPPPVDLTLGPADAASAAG
jgi:hypothetical protein